MIDGEERRGNCFEAFARQIILMKNKLEKQGIITVGVASKRLSEERRNDVQPDCGGIQF
jgi:hypothetical protein